MLWLRKKHLAFRIFAFISQTFFALIVAKTIQINEAQKDARSNLGDEIPETGSVLVLLNCIGLKMLLFEGIHTVQKLQIGQSQAAGWLTLSSLLFLLPTFDSLSKGIHGRLYSDELLSDSVVHWSLTSTISRHGSPNCSFSFSSSFVL